MSAVDLALDVPRFTAPALCAETDPELWYPEKGGSVRAAKRTCARCDARDECLAYALAHGLDHAWDGIWGGTTSSERRAMRPSEAAIPAPTPVLELVPQPEPERAVAPAAAARGWHPAELTAAARQLRAIGMPTTEIAAALDVTAARVRSALRGGRAA